MDIKANVKAAAKAVESKVQDVVAKVAGDPADQISAKSKQAEANLSNATAKNYLEDSFGISLQDKAKNGLINVKGKVQDAMGRLTDGPKNQAAGKAKQIVATARIILSDTKGMVKKAV